MLNHHQQRQHHNESANHGRMSLIHGGGGSGRRSSSHQSRKKSSSGALEAVNEALKEQKQTIQDMNKLIHHSLDMLAVRMETMSGCKLGAVLSMKQILRYEAIRAHAVQKASRLELLAVEIATAAPFNASSRKDKGHVDYYQSRVSSIVNTNVPQDMLVHTENTDELLEEARTRLSKTEEQTGRTEEDNSERAPSPARAKAA